MKLNQVSKDVIEKVKLISGTTYEECKDLFESLIALIFLNYLEDKETYIPYLGAIKPVYNGEEITTDGKVAKVSLAFTPDSNLRKIIGQEKDGIETEIEKLFLGKIKTELSSIMNKE